MKEDRICQRECTDGQKCDKLECGCKEKCTHRHARVSANNTRGPMEQTGTWVHQVARAMNELERGQAGIEDAGTEEESKRCKEDTWDFS